MSKLPCHNFEAMDHFAKCFLILRLEGSLVEGGLHPAEGDCRGWKAVRVDLVSPPMDRYAFALLGWSGSRVWKIIQTWKTREQSWFKVESKKKGKLLHHGAFCYMWHYRMRLLRHKNNIEVKFRVVFILQEKKLTSKIQCYWEILNKFNSLQGHQNECKAMRVLDILYKYKKIPSLLLDKYCRCWVLQEKRMHSGIAISFQCHVKKKRKTENWFQAIDSFPPQQFERDLRRFARVERRMLLDNHALYDKTKVRVRHLICDRTYLTYLIVKLLAVEQGRQYHSTWSSAWPQQGPTKEP